MPVQTVILAGGKGTRLRPHTNDLPKPMVPINGKPFLHHLINYLRSFSLNNILLLVGYKAEIIENYFKDGAKMDCSVKYSREEKLLGTGGALKKAEDLIEDEFLLINGDTYLPVDYSDLIANFHRNQTLSTITVYHDEDHRNNIDVDEFKLVTIYDKKNPKGLRFVDAGAIAFKKQALSFIPENRQCSLEEEIFSKFIQMGEMKAFITQNKFYDMGSIEGLKSIEGILQ